ncbi:hypothetical protein HRG_014046 [Hirsutella rhossiliensis]
MGTEISSVAKGVKRKAGALLDKLQSDVTFMLQNSRDKGAGFRYRFASKNAIATARIRYTDGSGTSGLSTQSVDVVGFTVLVRFLSMGLLKSLDNNGIPDSVREMTQEFQLPKFWQDYHDDVAKEDSRLGHLYLSGKSTIRVVGYADWTKRFLFISMEVNCRLLPSYNPSLARLFHQPAVDRMSRRLWLTGTR